MTGSFALRGFLDLYNVAKENVGYLTNHALSPTAAFNALCSVNHLKEWLDKDPSIPDPVKKDAQSIHDSYTTENSTLWVIRQLCNAHKHFDTHINTPATATAQGYGVGRYGMGGYGVGEPSYQVNVNGADVDFLTLLNDAIAMWDSFVTRNRLT